MFPCERVDLSFVDTAPFRFSNSVDLAVTPEQLFDVLADAEIVLPLEGLIDKEAELAKLRKSLADLDRQIAPLRAKLANESFTSRAPAEVVAASREKLAELEAQHASVAGLVEAARS